MQGQLVDLRDAYKVIRKALFIKQGQGCECMQVKKIILKMVVVMLD